MLTNTVSAGLTLGHVDNLPYYALKHAAGRHSRDCHQVTFGSDVLLYDEESVNKATNGKSFLGLCKMF